MTENLVKSNSTAGIVSVGLLVHVETAYNSVVYIGELQYMYMYMYMYYVVTCLYSFMYTSDIIQ